MTLGKTVHLYENVPQRSLLLEWRAKSDNGLLLKSGGTACITKDEVDAIKQSHPKIMDAFVCLGILNLTSNTGSYDFLVFVSNCQSVGKFAGGDINRITETAYHCISDGESNQNIFDQISSIRRLLNSGWFYFNSASNSHTFNLTSNLQRVYNQCSYSGNLSLAIDGYFLWNMSLRDRLACRGVDPTDWTCELICGCVDIRSLHVEGDRLSVALFSRLSHRRVGTRFHVRGCDDKGAVANFVETEQALWLNGSFTSHVFVRGSVPLFWDQPGVQVGAHKTRFTRSLPCSKPAFIRHIKSLKERYGGVLVIDLLSTKESEGDITSAHSSFCKALNDPDVRFIHCDLHDTTRSFGRPEALARLAAGIEPALNHFGMFALLNGAIQSTQNGAVRVNCLDCLDRTNGLLTVLGEKVLSNQLQWLGLVGNQTLSRCASVLQTMWLESGDQISRIYAGTGALGSDSKVGKLKDGAKSATRTIQNNFMDQSKQDSFRTLLAGAPQHPLLSGIYSSALSSSTTNKILSRAHNFSVDIPLRIQVGTWNVNGGRQFATSEVRDATDISLWLRRAPQTSMATFPCTNGAVFDLSVEFEQCSDLIAVGFQEIVDLDVKNLIAASTATVEEWSRRLGECLTDYEIIACTQLVGVCLFVFVRRALVSAVTHVETDSIKTGMAGTTGNKGGVAIRLQIYASTVCFVCGHLAAGQKNVNERNNDYATLSHNLRPGGWPIESHDLVVWCGDFNYRVDLENCYTKALVSDNSWGDLLAHDQLRIARENQDAFHGYTEAPIEFAPTYKYDMLSDVYDTSEKCRTPAWTDRVLWKAVCSDRVRALYYGRAELKSSDHRPVVAYLEMVGRQVVQEKRAEIIEYVVCEEGPPDATVAIHLIDYNNRSVALNEEIVAALIAMVQAESGSVVIVRCAFNGLILTLASGKMALAATRLNGRDFRSCFILQISLLSPNWLENILKHVTGSKSSLSPCSSQANLPFAAPKSNPPPRPPPPKTSSYTNLCSALELPQPDLQHAITCPDLYSSEANECIPDNNVLPVTRPPRHAPLGHIIPVPAVTNQMRNLTVDLPERPPPMPRRPNKLPAVIPITQ